MSDAVKMAASRSEDAVLTAQRERPKAQKTPKRGLQVSRRWTRAGVDPFDEIAWELRAATIGNEKGDVVFEQKDVEIPALWSQLATNVVVSKYFRGTLGTPQRERSVKQLIGRVANTMADWGKSDGYFASAEDAEAFRAELTYILLHQYASFNSPVWFNVGVEPKPQCSACQPYHALINTVDGLMPIGEIVEKKLVGLPVYDGQGLTQVVAVKHNGRKPVYRIRLNDGFSVEATGDHLVCAHEARRTRRIEWRRVDELKTGMVMRVYAHASTTVTELAEAKAVAEAALAGWLQADGFVGQYAHGTNQSLTVEFMTVDDQEFAWVMHHLDEAFPGHHYHLSDVTTDDTTLRCRRIRLYGEALRPFVERYGLMERGQALRVPQPIWTAPNDAAAAYVKSLFQSDGYAAVHVPSAHVTFAVTSKQWTEELQRLLTRFGIYARLRQKRERRPDRYDMWELNISIRSEREAFQRHIGFISERKNAKLRESLNMEGKRCPDVRYSTIVSIEPIGEMDVYDIQTCSGCYLTNSVLVHNCFILSVDDTMESILEWYRNEGMIFKYGSGSGLNVSPLRSSRERLAGGGTPSGPVSFMRAADASAGVIKSGGKTRRAAKMVVLNADHPDVNQFILCKWKEEEKAHKLIDLGYDPAIDGEAYGSVFFQNANNSVRATDEFMKRALADEEWDLKAVTTGEVIERVKAKDLLRLIAEATWHCGDPGMQFDTTINDWHTCPNTGRINASNPCFTGDARVYTDKGLVSFKDLKERAELGETFRVFTHNRTNPSQPTETISLTQPT
ncbi:MAG: LAGLIDADG family homing endonuclease, partial [Candidatus Omnitrophota bacterium]|nr:LAGLIDADG family homing endonuclease [Candidatus Omnitrophota bacterium]